MVVRYSSKHSSPRWRIQLARISCRLVSYLNKYVIYPLLFSTTPCIIVNIMFFSSLPSSILVECCVCFILYIQKLRCFHSSDKRIEQMTPCKLWCWLPGSKTNCSRAPFKELVERIIYWFFCLASTLISICNITKWLIFQHSFSFVFLWSPSDCLNRLKNMYHIFNS